jgi:hypothetical protein
MPPPAPPPPPLRPEEAAAPAATRTGADELAAAGGLQLRRPRITEELEPGPEPDAQRPPRDPPTPLDAAQGLLVGLAAGDRNRGPIQMCLALAESVGHTHIYDPAVALQCYREWWDLGQGDDAWDTGPTTRAVLERTANGCSLADAEQASMGLDRELGGMTAGVNAAHRVLALALATGCLSSGAELAAAARQESRLTHWSAISQDTCAVLCHLARSLLEGRSLETGMAEVLAMETAPGESVCRPLRELLSEGSAAATHSSERLQNDGFCPHVSSLGKTSTDPTFITLTGVLAPCPCPC